MMSKLQAGRTGVEPRSFLLGAAAASLVPALAVLLARDSVLEFLGGAGCTTSLSTPLPSSAPKSRYLIDPFPVNGPIKWACLPALTQAQFTLEGRVRVVETYPKKPNETEGPHWTEAYVQGMVELVKSGEREVGQRLSTYGPKTNQMFHDALKEFSVAGKKVLVLGSRAPWVEAFCIAYGAAAVTTVDFNKPTTNDPRLTTLTIPELDATTEVFDILVSYSSLEHDGLGRYGDPLNPNGDLERMKIIKGLLKPDGLLFLGVPNGGDGLVFSAHRVYGPVRFPLLIEGWSLLRTFGPPLKELYALGSRPNVDMWQQPLHVLSLEAS